ncbi:hypothetical protein BJF78_02160 [Pseudonocardia sp. CNS-139]|nr:hypothetical protein BJF78_02160 [Pseudonocardia sp. CNS-139]
MVPIQARIDALQAELAALPDDHDALIAAADAVAAWQQAVADGDVLAQRDMVKRAFPRLTLAAPSRRGDQSTARIVWNGLPT